MAEAAPAPAQPTPQVAPPQADQKAEDKQPAKLEVPKVGEKRGSQLLSEDQRKALEKQLLQRPDVEALRAHGIMKDGGRLAAAQAKLQRELKSDALARGLDHRPTQDELIASHIVEDRPVAPSLAAVARKLERNILANTLNQKLYTRTDVDALKQQGLLKSDNVAPRLRNAKVRLEHAITRDQLGHLLETRPTHEDLLRSGIIKPAPALSNKIAGVQRQLQHNMRVDKVGQLLERRSEVDNLQHRGVLPDMRIAPPIQGPQRALERSLARSNLYHALKHRPSLTELQERGVYVGDPYTYAAQQQNGLYPPEEGEGDDDEHQQLPLEEQQGGMEYILAQRQSLNMGQGGILNSGPPGSGGMQTETKQAYHQQQQQQHQAQAAAASEPSGYQRRSKNFHLTRILLKCVANMAEAGEISLQAKGYLKDLIVDQDKTILAVAETFDSENDINDFKESLITLASRQK